MFSLAERACWVTKCFGCLAPITQGLRPKQSGKGTSPRKGSPALTLGGKSLLSASGNGENATAASSSSSLRSLAVPATGPGNDSPWTRIIRAKGERPLLIYIIRGEFIGANGWSIGIRAL